MAVCLLFHIPSQLQGLVLYGDCTDLQGRSKASDIGEGGGVGDIGELYLKSDLQC